MKKHILILSMLILALVFTGCSDDDPVLVNELEVITTVEVTLTNGTASYVLFWEDLDGDGPNEAIVNGETIPAGVYDGSIQLFNKTVEEFNADGTENVEYYVTLEILDEELDHQFFFNPTDDLLVVSDYTDMDAEGKPIGQQFGLVADVSSGNLNIILLHKPDKYGDDVADGVITNAFGNETETDLNISFPITVE
jgi:hypothetical protein